MVVKDIEFPSTSWDLDTGPGININENPSYCPTIYIYYTTWFVHYLYNDSIYTYVYNIYIYTYIIDIYNTYPLSSLERHSISLHLRREVAKESRCRAEVKVRILELAAATPSAWWSWSMSNIAIDG